MHFYILSTAFVRFNGGNHDCQQRMLPVRQQHHHHSPDEYWKSPARIVVVMITIFFVLSPFIMSVPDASANGIESRLVERSLRSARESPPNIRPGIPNYGVFKPSDVPYLYETVPETLARYRQMKRRGRNTIFVSIASYRDEKCAETLADLFHKCKYCDRIFVGVSDQIDEGDRRCLPPKAFEKQVSIIESPAKDAK